MITGVSRGLGESLAFVLLKRGWQVVGLGRASAARLHGARYRFVEIDLADVSAIDAALAVPFAKLAEAQRGAVCLVNNAAVAGPVGIAGTLDATEVAHALAVNLTAPAVLANLFCRVFGSLARDRRIVNVSSGAAQSVLPGSATYCAAKAGLEMLTRTLAAEQGADGIRVVTLRPGIIDTGMQAFMRSQSDAVLPTVDMFRRFHAQGQLVAPDVAAAKIVERIIIGPVEQGRQYSYAEL